MEYSHMLGKKFVGKYINEEINEEGMLKNLSFSVPDNFNFGYDIVRELASTNPNKTALVWVGNDGRGKIVSFEEMERKSNQYANLFLRNGITKHDRVMLCLRRNEEFWYTVVALHKLGAIIVPVTDQLNAKDFSYRFARLQPKAVISTDFGKATSEIFDACNTFEGEKPLLFITKGQKEGWTSLANSEKENSHLKRIETSKDDIQLMFFSSGTTGYPKLVYHKASYPLAHYVTSSWWHDSQENGLHLTVAETGWAKAFWGKLYGQWITASPVLAYDFDRFNAKNLLSVMEKFRITTFCAPPTIYRFLVKENLENYDLSSIKHATSAGEPFDSETRNKFFKATGLVVHEAFGQTETTPLIFTQKNDMVKVGSIGKASPAYEIALIDEHDNLAADNEVGEICVKVKDSNVGILSQYDDEEKNAFAFRNGYYHTGDLAKRDENGYYFYVGRNDDLIKSSGYRIGPSEIEDVLLKLDYVDDCAVYGVKDRCGERGQLVKASIVLSRDTQPSEALKKLIQEEVKNRTAPYKYPRVVEFVTSLPKTISGKVMKNVLRRQHEERADQEENEK